MKRVLVVDDTAFMRLTIKSMLEKGEYEIVGEAENGIEAVKRYIECNPDIVTMDITMPEKDGISALKEIIKYDPDAKVIMLSAMGQEGKVREAVMSGAKTFIVKPFKEEFLLTTVKKVLG